VAWRRLGLIGGLVLLAVVSLVGLSEAAPQLALSWTDNANNEDGYKVERCQGAGCTGFALLAVLGANVVTYVDLGVAEGVTYCYRVKAYNVAGDSGYSNTACGTVPVSLPTAPSNLLVQ
jgi:hypothetical protein